MMSGDYRSDQSSLHKARMDKMERRIEKLEQRVRQLERCQGIKA